MKHKIEQKTTKRPKKRASSSVVAEVVGCAPCTVNQVLRGVRNQDTTLGQKIEVAKLILEEGIEGLITKAKDTIKQNETI